MAKTIRWGILGTAKIAETAYVPAIEAACNGELAAVASRNGDKANEFAAKHKIRKSYASYQELVDSPEVDALYIPLPNSMHAEWCRRAAGAGKPVLCEKPLAVLASEAQSMAALFKAKNLLLSEALMFRYHPMTLKVKEIIDSGRLGKLMMLHSQFNAKVPGEDNIRFKSELGGGALLDVGSYCVSVMRLLAGGEPISATANSVFNEGGVDISTCGCLTFPDGIVGHFGCSISTFFDCSYGAIGKNGRLLVEEGGMCAWPGGEFKIKIWSADDFEEIIIPPANHYQLIIEDFGEALIKGTNMRHGIDDTIANMRALDKLAEARKIIKSNYECQA